MNRLQFNTALCIFLILAIGGALFYYFVIAKDRSYQRVGYPKIPGVPTL